MCCVLHVFAKLLFSDFFGQLFTIPTHSFRLLAEIYYLFRIEFGPPKRIGFGSDLFSDSK